MRLQSLNISLKHPYSQPSESNPYEAKLSVSYNDNTMQVALSSETCFRILQLAGPEIVAAAQVQVDDFVRTAIAVSTTPAIEGVAQRPDYPIGF
ncbi:hypothetical protein [Pseudogemmobacter faecipullorum]|uniref:Uncharacterized protein n=1 Tax=Pseudogemmobacter faecipullorum TaxID=2755041 RepID=A0ABS8CQY7_9RHOB|nr:hypothetical protein [Pseudogemmobacter faecipullorum]MCB5411816.1 hypothetical protein [Pseudogemmobacter faecipullorum]